MKIKLFPLALICTILFFIAGCASVQNNPSNLISGSITRLTSPNAFDLETITTTTDQTKGFTPFWLSGTVGNYALGTYSPCGVQSLEGTSLDQITSVPTTNYEDHPRIYLNKIYAIKTKSSHYAKILITSLEARGAGPDAAVSFNYVYQPNGTPNF